MMPKSSWLRFAVVIALTLALFSCQSAPRAIEFGPLPNFTQIKTKVDVSGISYNLKFDAKYPIRDFQRVLETRLREHLQAQGLEVVPAADAAYTIAGEITITENTKYNGWLAVPIVGSLAGGVLSLGVPFGLAMVAAHPLVLGGIGASMFVAGLFGPPVVAASLAAPDTTFAREFSANVVLKDAGGNVVFSKTYDYFRSDCAGVYQRGSRSCKKINRTMAQAIDAFFVTITAELAMRVGSS